MAKKKVVRKASPPAKKTQKPPVSPAEPQPVLAALMAEEPDESEDDIFPIVGIGASAGGLEAFTEMLQTLPANTGMAFVFIQHLDPKHVSLLTELLQRQTSMGVLEATNGLKVEPNRIYVIPKNTHMSLVRGVLTLTPRGMAPLPHMPIDPFLRSLAAEKRSRAIGVILSGNASDGALGMMAIKAAGGITFAQSPESSKHDGMPRSAVGAGCIDFVLAPHEIGKELGRLGHHPYIAPSQPRPEDDTAAGHESMDRILALLWKATGVDFAQYKPNTLRRRILRRMALRRIDNLDSYAVKLRSDDSELKALYEDILINVTEFFRDPEAFDALKKIVFSSLLSHRESGAPIRIWVPGCSSGEEVYSIAIALLEFLEEKIHDIGIQIFGTDISEVALEKARNGIYSPSIIQDLGAERLRHFFTKSDSNYQISKRVREMCIFAKQNMVKDPPFSRLDLISCRNVLIYLGPALQKRLIPIFHYGLKPNGFLMLGSSETVGGFSDLFAPTDKKSKIYSKLEITGRKALQFPAQDREPEKSESEKPGATWTEAEVQREADRIVLGKYAPAGVVVDDDLNILQFRGRVGAYLQPFPGMASLSLVKMTSEGLSSELRNAVQKARREDATVRREALRVRAEAGVIELNFEVIPFKLHAGRARRYLILFEETRTQRPAPAARTPKKRPSMSTLERENVQLREENLATKRYLQTIVEEHESASEELRSANEEIQSSNEELQSTNEELETAKEELQSTNEELNTVNDELQTRNQQIAQAGNDLQNLLSSVNIPIVMLSNDLRIRRFTPVSQRALNLIPSDVGRPISDINLNLELPRLDRLLAEVIETLTPKVMDVKDLSGRTHSLRIRPYRTEDNKIEGVVMVLLDQELLSIPVDVLADPTTGLPHAPQEGSEALRAFSAGLLIAQERERFHLSRELHDDLTQRLALLELNLDTLQRKHPTADQLAENLQSFREQVTALSEDLRRIAYRLHPSVLDDLGLAVAAETFVRYFSERENIQVAFHQSNIPAIVDAGAALCLYRVLQESLHNVSKHSGAHSAVVTLGGTDGNLRLTVKDSGSGFDPKTIQGKGGLGLRSMEERAHLLGGKFKIHSDGKGTEVVVEVPHSPQSAGASDATGA
ncbi:MAG TPA: chemotaxis protein CheB [Bryobacteraceae bacterium]|jgi:two-component system CheB/CheR fusion protein|nr:chemotaxis protein CheB [Bryobacteraceae bacterium]